MAAMPEIGEVKFYSVRRHYGYLFVLDEAGQRTGEELFFHYNDAVYPVPDNLFSRVVLSDFTERETQCVAWPEEGDQLVFERKPSERKENADQVSRWTTSQIFFREEEDLAYLPFNWRLVRINPQHGPEAKPRVISSGRAPLDTIRGWDGQHFRLYTLAAFADCEFDVVCRYELQARNKFGEWSAVRSVAPVDSPVEYLEDLLLTA